MIVRTGAQIDAADAAPVAPDAIPDTLVVPPVVLPYAFAYL